MRLFVVLALIAGAQAQLVPIGVGSSPMMLRVSFTGKGGMPGPVIVQSSTPFNENPLQSLLGSFFQSEWPTVHHVENAVHEGVHDLFSWVKPIMQEVEGMLTNEMKRTRGGVVMQHVMKSECTCHCRADVKKFCGKTLSEKPGETLADVIECMHKNFDKLSGMCVSSLDHYDVIHVCGDEVRNSCADVIPGEGRLHACLLEIPKKDVSEKCGAYLAKDSEEASDAFLQKVEEEKHELEADKSEENAEDDDADDVFPMEELEKKVNEGEAESKELVVWTLSGIGAGLAILAAVVVIFKSRSGKQVRDRPIGYVPFLT